ncbi:MAG: GNAT family protein [Anaerolineales bacterium]
MLVNLPEDANLDITHEGGFEAMNGLQWLPSFSAYQYNSLCSRSSQMNIPTITTDHLNLRPFTEDDTGSLHKILAERDVLCYFPNPISPSREKVSKLIADQLNHWAEHAYGWWAVEALLSNSLIGGWGL